MRAWAHRALRPSACLLVAALAFGLAASANAQQVEIRDHSTLRVCADPDAMPFSGQDESGFENRIAQLFGEALGVPVRYIWFPSTIGFYRRTLNARRCDIVIGAAENIEFAQATDPYYRSSFAILTRKADELQISGLNDEGLRGKRIGVQARTPVADLVAQNRIGTLQAYNLMVDSRITSVGRQMADDLIAGTIDAAVVWGPIAAWQVEKHKGEFAMSMLGEEEQGVQLAFSIAMAVRRGEPQWRAEVNDFIASHQAEIDAILRDANVPMVESEGDEQ